MTFLNLTAGSNGGSVSVAGLNGTETLSSSSFSVPFDTSLVVSGGSAADAADNGSWALTNASLSITGVSGGVYTFSLSGTIGGCSNPSDTAGDCGAGSKLQNFGTGVLETFTATPVFATGNNYTTLNIGLSAPTSISDLLLTDLGYASSATTTETTTTSNIKSSTETSDNTTTGTSTFTPTSDQLSFTVSGAPAPAVPEPVSFLLLGSGLLGVALVARRRSVKV